CRDACCASSEPQGERCGAVGKREQAEAFQGLRQFGGLMRIVFGEIRITLDENCHRCEITGNHEVWRACGAVVFRYRRTPIAVVFSQVAVCMLGRIHAYAFQLPFSQLERCIVPTMQKSAVPASTMLGVVDKKI